MKLRIDALLLLVAAAGYVATSGTRVDPVAFGLLMVTGLLASAGASATNHYLDRDVDAKMRRTSARPLPARRILPPARALAFGLGLTSIGLGVAYLWINPLTAAMIGLGYVIYVGVYTMGLKRTHVSNIVIGGLAGSCPALAGSAAAANAISLPAALIALLVFLWTPGHFWALAYRNREGRVVIVDWKTGWSEGRFNEVQLAGYALYAAERGWVGSPEEIETELAYLAIPRYVRRSVDQRKLEAARAFIRKSAGTMKSLLVDPLANRARLEDFPMVDRPGVCRRCNFRRLCFPRAEAERPSPSAPAYLTS